MAVDLWASWMAEAAIRWTLERRAIRHRYQDIRRACARYISEDRLTDIEDRLDGWDPRRSAGWPGLAGLN